MFKVYNFRYNCLAAWVLSFFLLNAARSQKCAMSKNS